MAGWYAQVSACEVLVKIVVIVVPVVGCTGLIKRVGVPVAIEVEFVGHCYEGEDDTANGDEPEWDKDPKGRGWQIGGSIGGDRAATHDCSIPLAGVVWRNERRDRRFQNERVSEVLVGLLSEHNCIYSGNIEHGTPKRKSVQWYPT